MGLLNSYLNIKNKIKLNDAIVDGLAKAISNGVEQHVSQKLLKSNPDFWEDADKTVFSERITADSKQKAEPVDIQYQQKDEPDEIPVEEPQLLNTHRKAKSFKELKDSVTVYSDNNRQDLYGLNLSSVCAEPQTELYAKAKACINRILLNYLNEKAETTVKKRLFIKQKDKNFTTVLYFTLYLLVRATILKIKAEGEYVEESMIALDNAMMEVPDVGLWVVEAGQKYSQNSNLNNPESEELLEFLFQNSSFDEKVIDRDIYVALINFRNDVVSYTVQTLKNDLFPYCPNKVISQEKPSESSFNSTQNSVEKKIPNNDKEIERIVLGVIFSIMFLVLLFIVMEVSM